MKKNSKRVLSMFLSLAMLLSLTVMSAFAASDTTITKVEYTAGENGNADRISSITLSDGKTITVPADKEVTLIVDGVETAITEGAPAPEGEANFVITDHIGQIGSFAGGDASDYDFRTGLYVDETGIVESKSVKAAIKGGSYDAKGAAGISMTAGSENFNGIIVDGVDYTITDSKFVFESDSDGSDVNDFSGFGAVISAFNGAKVKLDNVDIKTTGVARLASFTDEEAHTLFANSTIDVAGGTIYEGYQNTADQAKMVAPPWVLGITGNARGTNLEGNLSSTTVYNSDMKAGQWGVISTDAGSDMLLNIVDSTLTLTHLDDNDPFTTRYGSGYGTYAIGNAQEFFRGATLNVGTYATILTGGSVHFGASVKGEDHATYALERIPNGTTVTDFMGNESEGYDVEVSDEAIWTGLTGKGQVSTINSDGFGFMSHGAADITLTEGTVVNTNYAVFLQKVGDANIEVTGDTKLNVADGVILQMIDNDDSQVGVTMPEGFNGPVFNTEYKEAAGWHKGDGNVKNGGAPVNFTATDVTLEGNLYNGSGSYAVAGMGPEPASCTANTLNVTLGKDAVLTGAISATALMHVDENGEQNTHFTMDEYYYLGHVANTNWYNGANDVDVTLTDNAAWTVTEPGVVTSLTVGAEATLAAAEGYTLKIVDATGAEAVPTTDADGSTVYAAAEGSYLVITLSKDGVPMVENFLDMDDTNWYYDGAKAVVEAGIMNGSSATTFRGTANITRQEIAAMLYRQAGSPEVGGDALAEFADGDAVASWASDAMLWAVQEGLITGTDNKLNPTANITRQELAAMLYRQAGSPEVGGNALAEFPDVSSVGGWASNAMLWAVQEGLISGTSAGTLAPSATATRGTVATMLARSL